MKHILIIFTLFCNTIIGQVHDYNIRIDYPKDPDSVYVLLTGNSGAFAGRGRFTSLPNLAALLDPYITGGGGSISDGDKGDITVSGSGATWTIDNSAITNVKILNDAVDASKIATDAVGSSEIAASSINDSELNSNLSATKFGNGTVSTVEFQYLNNVTSDIQGQINSKLNIADTAAMLDHYSIDANVVHKTGDETVAGIKSFSDKIKINGGSTGGNTGSENLYKMQIKMGHPPGYGLTVSNGTIDPWFHINSNGIGFVGNNDTIPFWSIESDVNLTKELRAHIVPGADYSYLWAKGGDVSNRNVLQLWGNDDIYLQAGRSNTATDLSGSIWLQGTEGTHFVDWGVISNASATVIDQVGGARLYQFTSGQVLKNLFQANGASFLSGNLSVGTSSNAQTLHVDGTARITGSDGTATTITGRDADGDISSVGVGSGLSLSAGSLSTTAILPADTASMLSHYIERQDTSSMLSHFVERSDTASMLSHFIERSDTAAMLSHFIERSDTASMLTHFIERADTASMLSHFVERSDTATMLTKYARLPGRSGGQTLIGGTGTTDDLILQSTSGVGATGALIQAKVGNNGGTTAFTILNNGRMGLQTITNPVSEYLEMPGSSTGSSLKVGSFECQSYALNNGWLSDNIYYTSGTGFTLRSTGFGVMSYYYNGAYQIRVTANSGSAGSTFTPKIPLVINRNSSASIGGDVTAGVGHVGAFMIVDSIGKVGIGTSVADKKLEVNLGTSDAFRLNYNDNNGSAATYVDQTLSSTGVVTNNAVGSASKFVFSDPFANTATSLTLGAAAATFALTSNVMTITGNGGGNTLTTITGGFSGQILVLKFVDANVTITDDATATANTINIGAAFTSTANDVISLMFDGTSWFETGRSVN